MNDFMKKYGESPFFSENKSRISLLQSFISKVGLNVKKTSSVIVSADGRPGTMSILSAIRDVDPGSLIRMLQESTLATLLSIERCRLLEPMVSTIQGI